MGTARDGPTWKNKAVSKGSDMSRGGNRTDKVRLSEALITLCGNEDKQRMTHVEMHQHIHSHHSRNDLLCLVLHPSSYLQGDDKVDPRGRGSWWLGTLKVGVTLQRGFTA